MCILVTERHFCGHIGKDKETRKCKHLREADRLEALTGLKAEEQHKILDLRKLCREANHAVISDAPPTTDCDYCIEVARLKPILREAGIEVPVLDRLYGDGVMSRERAGGESANMEGVERESEKREGAD